MATPASIAAQMSLPVSQREKEMNAAMDYGFEYVPGQAAGTAARMAQEKATADALTKSNAQIQSGFQPILDFYAKQATDTTARYAKNAANLTSIFGALSGISAKDTANINNQFASSITKQQADLATRTAEQRAAQTAGAAQAVVTGAERGNGPALQGSPTATATNQAIGQSNAIQTNWEGLLGAQKLNALTDVQNRGAGYSQQEIAANTQNTQNMQEALDAINSQRAGLEGQIAQAKVSRDQAIASGQAEAAQAAQDQIDALDLQRLKNEGSLNVAKTAAAAKLASRSTGGTSEKAKTYTKDFTGTLQRFADTFGQGFATNFQNSIDWTQDRKPTDASNAYNVWLKRTKDQFVGVPAAQVMEAKAAAKAYFNGIKYTKSSGTSGVQKPN